MFDFMNEWHPLYQLFFNPTVANGNPNLVAMLVYVVITYVALYYVVKYIAKYLGY